MLSHTATATNTSSLGNLVFLARRCFARCFSYFFGEHIDKSELNSRRIYSQYAHVTSQNVLHVGCLLPGKIWKSQKFFLYLEKSGNSRGIYWDFIKELLKNSL